MEFFKKNYLTNDINDVNVYDMGISLFSFPVNLKRLQRI